jgi:hypothetical protein
MFSNGGGFVWQHMEKLLQEDLASSLKRRSSHTNLHHLDTDENEEDDIDEAFLSGAGDAVVGRAIRSVWWGGPLTALDLTKNRVAVFFIFSKHHHQIVFS